MKTRISLILLALMIALPLVGCQRSVTKTDEFRDVIAEEPPQPKSEKSVETAPSKNTYKLNWEEKCSVEQATAAAQRTLEDLGLGGPGTSKTRTVTTRDPKTGRMITRQVPVSTGSGSGSVYSKSDGLSAIVAAKSVTGVEYNITILLTPPQSCDISITTVGPHPTDILSKHVKFIKQQISEAIKNPEAEAEPEISEEPLPYPETMIFNRTVSEVYKAIYNWSSKERFRHSGRSNNDDRYYKSADIECASGIKFSFSMRLIDDNKTKLDIKASGYEGKDEFDLILQGLMETLQELKTDQPVSKTTAYTETKTLNHPISAVYEMLMSWAKENGFSIGRNAGGDAFYKYFSFNTAAGIGFDFRMYMIGENETKLGMTVTNQQDREEFPMILKSLRETIEALNKTETPTDTASKEENQSVKEVPDQKQKPCQSN